MEPEISNLTLDKLYEFEPLSKETLMFCQGYHLYDVKSIVQFYQLRYCVDLKLLPHDAISCGRRGSIFFVKYDMIFFRLLTFHR